MDIGVDPCSYRFSTEDSFRDREKGLELGASDYLMKPIQLDRLKEVIKNMIGE